jgi:hypothetical protein
MNKRIFFDIVVFLSVILLPWWIWLPGILAGIVLFPQYIEGVILATLADVLYGAGVHPLVYSFPFGMISAILVIISVPIRERFRTS